MREYSFNASWLVFEKAIRILATTFVAFYIARYLGPKDFGQLSYALAWLAILGSVASLGLDGIALREISFHPDRANTILSTGIIMRLLVSLILVAIICGTYLFSSKDLGIETVFIASCALVFQPLNLCEIFFQAKAQSKKIIQFQVIQSFISSLIKLIIIYINGSLELLLWSYVFDSLLLGVGIYQRCQNQEDINLSLVHLDITVGKRLLITSFPILLSGLSIATYMKIDLIMLEDMASQDQLGIYSAAAKLSESWYFIPVAISSAFSPLLFRLKKQSQEAFQLKLKELYSLLIWGSALIGVVVSIFSADIIRIVFGSRFDQAGQVLIIHIWSGIFVCIGLVNSLSLLSHDRLYQNLLRTLLGAIINVMLNIYLIPIFGALGAAYATLVAYAFTAWISMIFFKNGLYEFMLPIKSLTTIPKVL